MVGVLCHIFLRVKIFIQFKNNALMQQKWDCPIPGAVLGLLEGEPVFYEALELLFDCYLNANNNPAHHFT